MPDIEVERRNKDIGWLTQVPLLTASAILGATLAVFVEILIGAILAIAWLIVSRALAPAVSSSATGYLDESGLIVFVPGYIFGPTAPIPGACAAFLVVALQSRKRLKWFMPAIAAIVQILAIYYMLNETPLSTHSEALLVACAAVSVPIMLGLYASVTIVLRVMNAKG